MSHNYALAPAQHQAFGRLLTLVLRGQPQRRFTQQEALIVGAAIAAVAGGRSAERTVYMSPIASDHDFQAAVEKDGIVVGLDGCDDVALAWSEALALARELSDFGAPTIAGLHEPASKAEPA